MCVCVCFCVSERGRETPENFGHSMVRVSGVAELKMQRLFWELWWGDQEVR